MLRTTYGSHTVHLYCDNKHSINKIMEELHSVLGKRCSKTISKWDTKEIDQM